jgi:hypothetical protein
VVTPLALEEPSDFVSRRHPHTVIAVIVVITIHLIILIITDGSDEPKAREKGEDPRTHKLDAYLRGA